MATTPTHCALALTLAGCAVLPAASFTDIRLTGMMQSPITDGTWSDARIAPNISFDLDDFEADGNFSAAIAAQLIHGRTLAPKVGFVIGAGFVLGEHVTEVTAGPLSEEYSYQAGGVQLTGGLLLMPTEQWSVEVRPWFTYGQGTLIPEDETDIDEERLDDYTSYGIMVGTYYAFAKPGFLVGAEIGYAGFEGDFEWDIIDVEDHSTGSLEGANLYAAVTLGFRF